MKIAHLLGKLSRALHKKMNFSIKDFFSKCDQIRRKLRIWSHLLEKSLMGNFTFCAVETVLYPHQKALARLPLT